MLTRDISLARRIKGTLNVLVYLGVPASLLLIIASFGDWRFLLLLVAWLVALRHLHDGSPVAAAALALIACGVAFFIDDEYRRELAGLDAHLSTLDRLGRASVRRVVELDHWLSLAALGTACSYVVGLVLCVIYRRLALRPRPQLGRRERLVLRLKMIAAGLSARTMLYFGLSAVCGLGTVGSSLVLGSRSPHFGMSTGTASSLTVVAAILLAVGCLFFQTRGKRSAALSSAVARRLDSRRPILLLRSFGDDLTPLYRTISAHAWMRNLVWSTAWTLEETLEDTLSREGPVIAVGRPGETLPPAGAAREYLPNDAWRSRVKDLIAEARFVVAILGTTEGLEAEYRLLAESGGLGKLIAIFPPRDAAESRSRWDRFCQLLPELHQSVAELSDPTRAVAAYREVNGVLAVLTSRWRDDEDCYRIALGYCCARLST